MKAWHSIVLLYICSYLHAAKLSTSLFDITISGYIKGESYTDSRQTLGDELDQITFFPRPQIDDKQGHDINAHAATYMDAFETRGTTALSGLTILDAQVSGVIEADFEYFDAPLINAPHLRHAYGKLDWEKLTFIFGQTWHPVVFIESKTINYSGSSPFDFYARSPQFACMYHINSALTIAATATSQVDFESDGPYGYSSNYIRWAVIPNCNLQCRWYYKKYKMSLCIDYKCIAPRIVSDTGFKVHERLHSIAVVWAAEYRWPFIELNTKVNWGQNATDYGGMGGYAVIKGSRNPITHEQKYTNISNVCFWLDVEIVKNKKLKPGIFIGFSYNLGSTKKIECDIMDQNAAITRNIFGFATDVKNVFRISPRITSTINNITLAGEVEYTNARYGMITHYAHVINTRPAELIRCTFAGYYYF